MRDRLLKQPKLWNWAHFKGVLFGVSVVESHLGQPHVKSKQVANQSKKIALKLLPFPSYYGSGHELSHMFGATHDDATLRKQKKTPFYPYGKGELFNQANTRYGLKSIMA